MPLKTSRSDELPAVNLTPMIDVVFLLIIFFMVGTQFSQSEQQIGLKLPGAGQLKNHDCPARSSRSGGHSRGSRAA